MMKSFFKKLAFVMALAMVVSLAAPAGSALAAESLNITVQGTRDVITEYNLPKVGDTVDFQFWKAPSNWATDYEWDCTRPGIVSVDQAGFVTALAEGTTTVTITVLGTYYGEVEVTVGEVAEVEPTTAPVEPTAAPVEPTVAPVEPTAAPIEPTVAPVEPTVAPAEFKAEQVKDNTVKLTLTNKEVTKEALEESLVFYYYVGDYKVEYPIKVSEVKDGVATLVSFITFNDGTKYGFEFAGNTSEFVAVIGDVAEVVVEWSCNKDKFKAYAGEETTITAKLLNAKGIDITTSALDGDDKYIKYTLVEEAAEGEYYIPDETQGIINFDSEKLAIAKVKVEYVTGEYDENYEAIPGAYAVVDIMSEKAPAYGMDVSKGVVGTIVLPGDDGSYSTDFKKTNTVIALGDEYGAMNGARLAVQLTDTKGNKVSTLTDPSLFSFESTNNEVAYVDSYGYIMTNSVDEVYVIVYYTPDANTATVVGVTALNVREERTVKTLSVDKTSSIISTEDPYNTADFKVTLKDQLGDKKDGKVKVECLTKLPTGAVSLPTVSVDEANTAGGELTFTVTGSVDNLPIVKGKQATTYSYAYKISCGNISKQITVKVNKPDGKIQGVEIAVDGGTDLKTTDDKAKAVSITVYTISNGVKNGVLEIAPKGDKSKAIAGQYYYSIAKDGKDITGSATGTSIDIDLTTIESKTVNGTASGSSLDIVKKTATGTYTVTIYKANGTAGQTATGFVSNKTKTFTVTDSQDKMTFAGRADGGNSYEVNESTTVEDIVKDCFKFKVGSNDVDYNKTHIVANANVANGGLVAGTGCFIKTVDFYVLVGTNTYMKYTVTVNSYVELK